MPDGALLSVEPVLGYPRAAQPGASYLLTVDLRAPLDAGGWPYEQAEEMVIYCLVNAGRLFRSEPFGEPAVVIHRFGGTYGPARFLLTAADQEQTGTIQVTLVNGWGVPLIVLETDEIRIAADAAPPAGRASAHAAVREPAESAPEERAPRKKRGFLEKAERMWPGKHHPLGASWDGEGTNFAIYSESAEAVELCIFREPGDDMPAQVYQPTERTGFVWHGYVPGVAPGALYGFRVNGSYDPERGIRCNPFKLLVDPYARALAGRVDWSEPLYGFPLASEVGDLALDDERNDPGVPKGVVLDNEFDWRGDRPPRTPWNRTVIYEAHVKGLTALHPDVPEKLRGTYAGVAHPAVIAHLKGIGATAVELLPVHAFVDEPYLSEKGLRNYWGYNTLNFFSPEARYSGSGDRGGQVREFKEMVRALHAAGIEVILDVVYNHTAEGNHLGPTLSFRGIDNPTYYRLIPDNPRYYMDYTGTGNSLNTRHPQTLQMVMDSLRYWVQEMHVDGFRFDLASTLAREEHAVDPHSRFFTTIQHDPVLSQVKLIAEPWDVGEGGYQSGNFPFLWAEWNGRYRDAVRSFWRGDPDSLAGLAYRLSGSSDLFQDSGRRPTASINYVATHDSFTLNDLVSYNEKHNEANGEGNRDGQDHNISYNYGAEGPTDDRDIIAEREKQKRNFLATLFLSQGVPMIYGGDEMGHTQGGNNNAYCQDNEISWLNWDLRERDAELLAFARGLAQLRAEHPTFRRTRFFRGRPVLGSEIKDVTWLHPDGREMTDEDWGRDSSSCFGMLLGGDAMEEWGDRGEPVTDDDFLVLFNAGVQVVDFTLPRSGSDAGWEWVVDTRTGTVFAEPMPISPDPQFLLFGRSLVVLRARRERGN